MLRKSETGRILLADDHPLIREGLRVSVEARHPNLVVDCVDSIAAAEEITRSQKSYLLMLLDYQLPDSNGYSGFFRMLHKMGRTPIAIISTHDSPGMVATARAIGAAGFLSKRDPLDSLVRSIESLLEGKTAFPPAPSNSGHLADLRKRVQSLSAAQMRVLALLAKGHLNKQIAGDLDLSEATVKAHMSAVLRKLGVNNRLQAALSVRPLFDPDP